MIAISAMRETYSRVTVSDLLGGGSTKPTLKTLILYWVLKDE